MPKKHLVSLMGISRSKYYRWQRCYGEPNQHNSSVPRWFWLEDWERDAIASFSREHPLKGYRRLAYMMIDADVVAASPSTVYRVLKERGLIGQADRKSSRKGEGFDQPSEPHEHWHMDISYVNICGTFYYLCGVLDGYSRYVVHWDIRESMTEKDIEIILQGAREKYPEATPRIISDNGPQFIAKDFKEYIKLCGMTHVTTSPFYPQSNGKYERWNQSVKAECIRPKTPLSLEDARRVLAEFIDHYNDVRLHSAIGYIAPLDKLEGRVEAIIADRERKLAAARERRKRRHMDQEGTTANESLTTNQPSGKKQAVGETEAGSAEEQPARDSRPRQATRAGQG